MGVLAYEMVTAQLPYDGASMPALLGMMLRGSPEDPRSLQPTLPEGASAALNRALRPVPEERFGSASELGSALGV